MHFFALPESIRKAAIAQKMLAALKFLIIELP